MKSFDEFVKSSKEKKQIKQSAPRPETVDDTAIASYTNQQVTIPKDQSIVTND